MKTMTGTNWHALVGTALAVAALLGTPERASTQQTVEGPAFRANVMEIAIGGRVQTQFNTTTVDGEPPSEIFLRRVRLEANVKVNELVSGKIAPDFAGSRLSLKDAYLKLNFDPALQLLVGQAHRPFGLLEQTSSTRILPIERGADIRGIAGWDEYSLVQGLDYSGRDIGLQVMGEPDAAPLGLAYAAGVFRGPVNGEIGDRESFQIAARATITPAEQITLGAGWSSRHFAVLDAATEALIELDRGHAFEVDLEYGAFAPGVHFLGEVAFGDFDPFDGRFIGAQGWLGYRTGPLGLLSAVEPLFRASYGDVDGELVADELGGVLLTPGINFHLGGLNRVMVNYDFWRPNGEADPQGSFKAQFQLAF